MMPIVQVQRFEGRSLEMKRNLVSGRPKLTCDVLEVSPDVVRIILNEMSRENFAIAGTLVSERK